MHWAEITAPPSRKTLRQFAGLLLIVFGGMAAWRLWNGQDNGWTQALLVVGAGGGTIGLLWPEALRWVYTGWMVAVFPIGWTISRLALMTMFYLVFAPVALLFRAVGRDALHRRRRPATSYWTTKPMAETSAEYLRQF